MKTLTACTPEIEKELKDEYSRKFPLSKEKHDKLSKLMPSGHVANVMFFRPYPLYIQRGEGPYVFTYEGERLIDFFNGYSVLIHGHADKDVAKALDDVAKRGYLFCAPTDAHIKFSQTIIDRVPCFERARVCNSGTESTLFALRTARVFKKKPTILKILGGYHGSHDCVAASTTMKNPMDEGVPSGMIENMLEVEFNDVAALEAMVKKHKNHLAAVIIEPFMGSAGTIAPQPGYLEAVRKITKQNDVLLIFDEIVSFRTSKGGAQEFFKVIPDIAVLGKFVGGGFPIGVFGGRSDIMAVYDQEHGVHPIHHGGTFFGSEPAMVAGVCTLNKLGQPQIDYINRLGSLMEQELVKVINKNGLHIKVNRVGSIMTLHYTDVPVINFTTSGTSKKDIAKLIHLALLTKGIYTAPFGRYFILSTCMTEAMIMEFVGKYDEVIAYLKPYIAEKYPHLIKE